MNEPSKHVDMAKLFANMEAGDADSLLQALEVLPDAPNEPIEQTQLRTAQKKTSRSIVQTKSATKKDASRTKAKDR